MRVSLPPVNIDRLGVGRSKLLKNDDFGLAGQSPADGLVPCPVCRRIFRRKRTRQQAGWKEARLQGTKRKRNYRRSVTLRWNGTG